MIQRNSLKTSFVAFANSGGPWINALKRIGREARKSGYFNYISQVTEDILSKRLPQQDFDFIKTHSKGYGYWIWKPHVILDAFESKPDADVVVYLDSGCQINWTNKAAIRYQEYLDLANIQGFVAFQLPNIEKNWTDPHLLNFLKIDDTIKNSGQIAGGVLILRRDFGVAICESWLELMRLNNYQFLIGSNEPDLGEEFIEHRHDQSILSLLLKSQKSTTFLASEEIEYEGYNEKTINFPFWAARNPSRTKVGTGSLFMKVCRKMGL